MTGGKKKSDGVNAERKEWVRPAMWILGAESAELTQKGFVDMQRLS